MKVTINEREYELKELTKEQAKEYIGKEVYVWDDVCTTIITKHKLLKVFEPFCRYPFCALSAEVSRLRTAEYEHCAPVPEEWYVNYYKSEDKYKVDKECFGTTVDHGSEEYCKQKAKELNEQKATEHPLTYYEVTQLLKCFGVDLGYMKEVISNTIISYVVADENKALSDVYKIRYKCGEWMPATRRTVLKWCEENKADMFDEVKYFVLFMGWDKE